MRKKIFLSALSLGSLITTSHADNAQIKIFITGRNPSDTLPLHVYMSLGNAARNSFALQSLVDGDEITLDALFPPPDPQTIVFGCVGARAWLLPKNSYLPDEALATHHMHRMYAGTEVVSVNDIRDQLLTLEIVLMPACDLRLRVLDTEQTVRQGFAWTGYGDTSPSAFPLFTSKDFDGEELETGQGRLLGIPRDKNLRVWLHDRTDNTLGSNSYRFDPIDIDAGELNQAVANVELTWTPPVSSGSAQIELEGYYDVPGADESFYQSIMTTGLGYGDFLCVREDRQQFVLVTPSDETIFNAPYVPNLEFTLPGVSGDVVVPLNVIKFNYSATLPAGTWDILPGGLDGNDNPTLRRLLEDPIGLPGPFPGVTRITVEDGIDQSVNVGSIGVLGMGAIFSAVWCSTENIYSVIAPAGVGRLPNLASKDNQDDKD